MQRRVPLPSLSDNSAALQFPAVAQTALPRNGLTQKENFHLPSQPLSWLPASGLTGPPGRKPNVLVLRHQHGQPLSMLPCSALPHCFLGVHHAPHPTTETTLKNRASLLVPVLRYNVFPQAHRLARPPGQRAGPEPVSLGTHTHTKK